MTTRRFGFRIIKNEHYIDTDKVDRRALTVLSCPHFSPLMALLLVIICGAPLLVNMNLNH